VPSGIIGLACFPAEESNPFLLNITFISYFVLQSFTLTWKNITGIILSTIAAIIITINSLYNNIKFENKKKRRNYNKIQENNNDGAKEVVNTSL
jgi:hypothetical protein